MRKFWVVTALLTAGLSLPSAASAALQISEFRLRGPNGANDEFVQVHNPSGTAVVVSASDGTAGFALAASDGVARAVIPNGTTIAPHGHWLAVNSIAYSLSGYPAGNGTTATGDATYTTDIPDNAGVALFDTANPADFTLAHRLDAVGSTAEANTLYKEGSGHPSLTPFSIDYAFVRDQRSGAPADTNNNAADLLFVDTNGTSAGAGQRLGAPGPENLSSPIAGGPGLQVELADPAEPAGAAPNTVRDFTSDPGNNSTFGTIEFRRRVTNTGPDPLTRLRFRIVDLSTFPSPSGVADLRPRTSTAVVAPVAGSTETIEGTTLEQPPSQPNGGGFNSSMSVGTVALATPLAPGDSVFVRFLMGIQQAGDYRFCAMGESLPGTQSSLGQHGGTEAATASPACGLTPPACDEPLGAVGCWPFDEPSGTTAFDASSQGNDGAYLNGPTLGVPGIAAGTTAVAMDGVNDHVSAPDAPSLDVGDSFTLEGWIKRDEDGHTHQLFSKGTRGFHLLVMDHFNGNQVWLRKAGVATIVRSTGPGVPADGQFHHVVATKDGPNSAQLYVDGVAQSLQQVSPAQVIENTAYKLRFSAPATGDPVDGVLDEFAVYDEALTATDIEARFVNGPTGLAASTTATSDSTTAGATTSAPTGDGTCSDVGRADSGITAIRTAKLSCERAAELASGGPRRVAAAGLDCTITREDFSRPIVRITRECVGSGGRRLDYTTRS